MLLEIREGTFYFVKITALRLRVRGSKEIERWRLSLLGLGRFIADNLRSTFVNAPNENGIKICICGGYEYLLEKEKTGGY